MVGPGGRLMDESAISQQRSPTAPKRRFSYRGRALILPRIPSKAPLRRPAHCYGTDNRFRGSAICVACSAVARFRSATLGAVLRSALSPRRAVRCPSSSGTSYASAGLSLTVVLFAACGGSGDASAKVAANLQHYLNASAPRQLRPGGFPVGAGPPRVKENGCRRIPRAQARPRRSAQSWSCVVTFAHVPFRVLVAVNGADQIASVSLVPRHVLRPGTATVYQGGPKAPKP